MSTQPIAPKTHRRGTAVCQLEAKVREFRPKDDLAPQAKAYRFASEHHSRQKRDSGEPFMNHPLSVAYLADMKMDLI
jgi:GTP pyrophosphokinase